MKWAFQSADARAAFDARSDLIAYLQGLCTPDSDVAAAELIYGELVGNVVRHAPGPIDVTIEWNDGNAVLTIVDAGRGFSWKGDPTAPDAFAEGGRGLFIVSQLGHEFAAEPLESGGMRARVRLPIKRL